MKLSDILYSISFCTGMLGGASLGGDLEFGTGYLACAVLFLLCILSAIWGLYEDGYLSKK